MIGSGGTTGGPAGHWPTHCSVWLTQFIGPPTFLFGLPNFLAVNEFISNSMNRLIIV